MKQAKEGLIESSSQRRPRSSGLIFLDSRFRGNDDCRIHLSFPNVISLKETSAAGSGLPLSSSISPPPDSLPLRGTETRRERGAYFSIVIGLTG